MLKRCMGASLALLALALSACGSGSSSDSSAATVNGQDISLVTYDQAVYQKRIETSDSLGYDPCSVKGLAPACALLKKQVLQTLIDGELVRQYAAAHHITVSRADFAAEWAKVFQNRFDSRPDVLAAYARRMHTTKEQIKQAVSDDLLQSQVIYAVTQNMSPYTPAVRLGVLRAASAKELKQIRRQMAAGKNFLDVAYLRTRQPGTLCAKQGTHCGDVGWIPYAFVPPNEKKITTAPLGSVVGPYGGGAEHDLYLVEARDLHYRMSPRQAFAMRSQILFKTWLKKQERAAKVTRHVEV